MFDLVKSIREYLAKEEKTNSYHTRQKDKCSTPMIVANLSIAVWTPATTSSTSNLIFVVLQV